MAFDDALGSWQSQCTEITQATTVSATITATGFGHTADDPVTARIARQLSLTSSTWWEPQP